MFGVSNLLWLYEGRGVLEQKLFVQYVTETEKKELAEYVDSIIKNKEHIENLVIEGNPCKHYDYKQFVKEYFKALKKEKKECRNKKPPFNVVTQINDFSQFSVSNEGTKHFSEKGERLSKYLPYLNGLPINGFYC